MATSMFVGEGYDQVPPASAVGHKARWMDPWSGRTLVWRGRSLLVITGDLPPNPSHSLQSANIC